MYVVMGSSFLVVQEARILYGPSHEQRQGEAMIVVKVQDFAISTGGCTVEEGGVQDNFRLYVTEDDGSVRALDFNLNSFTDLISQGNLILEEVLGLGGEDTDQPTEIGRHN